MIDICCCRLFDRLNCTRESKNNRSLKNPWLIQKIYFLDEMLLISYRLATRARSVRGLKARAFRLASNFYPTKSGLRNIFGRFCNNAYLWLKRIIHAKLSDESFERPSPLDPLSLHTHRLYFCHFYALNGKWGGRLSPLSHNFKLHQIQQRLVRRAVPDQLQFTYRIINCNIDWLSMLDTRL